MGYNELELELRKVLSLIERWRTLGYVPTIEQGVALERMQRAYVELLDMPCGGEAEGAAAEAGATAAAHGMEWSAAEDHEVMQGMAAVGSGVVAAEASWVVDEADDFAAGKAVGTTELETVQPDAQSGMEHKVDETAGDAVMPSEPQQDSETEPVADGDASEEASVEEVAEEAEEEHSVHAEPDVEAAQESEPAVEELEETVTETTVEVTPEAPVAAPNADVQTESASAPEEPASKPEPEPAPAPKPQLPRIFGIEVSPYTRHEIIDTLFHGNTEMFEAEVAKLNAMGSLEEALVYIGETYHWIPENAATVKFIDLLETRFDS